MESFPDAVLTRDLPEHGLSIGDVGTVVERHENHGKTGYIQRGNRRYPKMQKTVYRVRTAAPIRQRIALDGLRDAHAKTRRQTSRTLHQAKG